MKKNYEFQISLLKNKNVSSSIKTNASAMTQTETTIPEKVIEPS
jgi:hypothetical protein